MMTKPSPIVIHVTQVGGCIRRALLELQGTDPTDERDYYSRLGTLVHKVAEILIKDWSSNGSISIMDAMEQASKVDPEFYTENYHAVFDKVAKLHDWLNSNLEILTNLVGVEVNVRHPLTWSPNHPVRIHNHPIILTGTADIVTTDGVIDLKSGKSRHKKHAWQVSAYTKLLEMETSARIVYLGEHFHTWETKTGVVKHKHERFIPYDSKAKCIEKYWDEYLHAVRDYMEQLDTYWDDIPEPLACGDCFFCSYRSLCGMGGV